MIKLLIGKTVDEVKNLITNYYNMIDEKEYNPEVLEEANCYDEIYKQQNRKNCATIPWRALEKRNHFLKLIVVMRHCRHKLLFEVY